jgi:Protein of unknown function (DUF1573)
MRKLVLALAALVTTSPGLFAQQPAWANKLFGAETTHDFGVVARGAQLKYSFKMTNIYKEPLEITDLSVSCTCTKAEASVKVLQPNESAMLNVTMDARKFNGAKTVLVYVRVGPKFVSTATLTVSANARGDVTFSPSELDFGNLQRGQTPSKTFDVEYTGSLFDWRVTEIVKNSSAPFDLKVEEFPRVANGPVRKGYRLTATIKAEPSTGSFKQEVVLKTNDASAPVLTFNIVGNIQAGLAVSPGSITVKELKVGETETKKVLVRAARPFKVISVDGQGDGITVDVPNRQETTLVLTVHIQPTKTGDIRRQLLIRTDLDDTATPLMVEATIEP